MNILTQSNKKNLNSSKSKSSLFIFAFLIFIFNFSEQIWAQGKDTTRNGSAGFKNSDPLPANAFIELAKLMNPTVVNISTSSLPKQRRGRDPFFDMLEQFYGIPVEPRARPQQALGTGFIIREDGLIVTNNHVIAGADTITVQIAEGSKKTYEATLIGSDDRTDIALIKIKAEGKLPVAELGSSKEVEVGEWVAAFGNPLGAGHTMTKGIISAKGRDIAELNKFPLLQTDTPINPGNSGGPLVNLKGQVIGVNNAIVAGAQGIGFAIPIDEVKNIIPVLEKNGRISKGYLGVGLADIDPNAAASLGLKNAEGVIVAQVDKNGPAYKAGIRPYDVIKEYNGKKISNSNELQVAVADTNVGKTVKIEAVREGKNKSFQVTLNERPEPGSGLMKNKKSMADDSQKAPLNAGFSLTELTEAQIKENNLDPELKGKPMVTEIQSKSGAAQSGLRPGDIILDVNRIEVNNSAEVFKKLKRGTNTLRIARGPQIRILLLNIE